MQIRLCEICAAKLKETYILTRYSENTVGKRCSMCKAGYSASYDGRAKNAPPPRPPKAMSDAERERIRRRSWA